MELGSWSIIQAPSLLALIPLVVYIVLVFRGKNNVSGIIVGIFLAVLMLGQNLKAVSVGLAASLGSSTALIGMIIMAGAGLDVLMSEAGVSRTMVYWIVKRIGVNDVFGHSGPAAALLKQFGLSAENIVAQAKAMLNQ